MGIAGVSFVSLIQKVVSWFGRSSTTPESDMSGCYSCGSSSAGSFSAAAGERLLCDKCMQVSGLSKFGSYKVGHGHVAESGRFSSPVSFSCRSDEEDVSDVDSVSISTGLELDSCMSLNYSLLDSPSKASYSIDDDNSHLDREVSGYFRKTRAEIQGSLETSNDSRYDSVSLYINQETQESKQRLDFENDVRIWDPPVPLDEHDDVESGFLGYDDEDDEVGNSSSVFSSGSFSSDSFSLREKPTESQEHLKESYRGHFRYLVFHVLKENGVRTANEDGSEGWFEIVSSLAWQAATYVKPDTSKGGSMDPVNYVKVKCILSGRPSDSTLVKGVVCTKNVKHKRMISQHKNPRLFLLGGALEYQRVPNELASIDTVLQQERDHLKMSVAKIEAHRPNVLLVEKSVSSYAQEYLLRKEISLVMNVKKTLLEKISLCTGAQIAPSIDNIASARLGHCEMFHVEKFLEECSSNNYQNKKSVRTLMYFDGCPRRLGCTVLLRGTHLEELKKVKHVFRVATFAAYHLSHETSFLADEGATLPKVPLSYPKAIPAKLMEADTCISKVSASTILNACQIATGGYPNLGSCSNLSENCIFPCTDICLPGGAQFCDISCSSFATSQLNGGLNDEPSYSPSDSILESTFEDGKELTDHSQLRAAGVKKIMDTDGGKETLTECFPSPDKQSILVSLSTTCVLKGCVCEPSQVLRIKFYGSCDKTIGRYIREDLFDQSCKEPAEAHVRCYTHQNGSLTINVKRLPSIRLPGERDGRIWMWHRCLKCEQKDGIPPAAPRVVMSEAALGISFGKILDLSFSNHTTANRVASCGHSLQRDCLRFYGSGSMVAFIRYSPVDILSVHLPPLVLDFTSRIQQDWARREAAEICSKIGLLHVEVSDVLQGFQQKIMASEYEHIKTSISKCILQLKDMLERERNIYDVLLQPSLAEKTLPSHKAVDVLDLNRLRHYLLIDSHMWDCRLRLLDLFCKSKSPTSKFDPQFPAVSALATNLKEWQSWSIWKDEKIGKFLEEFAIKISILEKQHEEFSLQFLECHSKSLVEMDLSIESVEGTVGDAGLRLVSGQCYKGVDGRESTQLPGPEACMGTSSLERRPSDASVLSDKIDLAWTGNPGADSVGSLTLVDNPVFGKVMSPVRFNSFDSSLRCRDGIRSRSSSASLHLSSVKSFDASSDLVYRDCSRRSPKSVKRFNFFPNSHSPVFISSTFHMVAEGARLLLPQTGHDVVIVVYDDEPTTIISYAISTQEHADFVTCKLDQHDGLNEIINTFGRPSISQFQPDEDPQLLHRNSFKDTKESHFRISFNDDSSIPSDKVKFSVTCYFAKQFHSLRKKCCPKEQDFLRSLSRCKRWNAQGGKSNVFFAKSLDERFVIKQVTKTELDSFEKFAPEYFKYLTESINSGSPTCLAKVLGLYQVTVKHLKGGRELKMDLMVMENLLFGRNLLNIYDLKGSLRGRYNPDTSGGNNNVLLDMNLLETIRTKPIFLGSKAKRRFDRAVWNDTSFLASIDVMDYSLLVGIDAEKKELVIGMIDFMRQYTWDKHLETLAKASGILGGPKNVSPTIVSPLEYKHRFRKAMSNYFVTVPDQWSSS